MDSWKTNMPQGMILRSHADWHLDPAEIHTIEQYCEHRGLALADVEPLSRDYYLEYVDWFIRQKGIAPLRQQVEHLNRNHGAFEARLDNGDSIRADKVILAIGFRFFKNIPAELSALLPAERVSHTCDLVEFDHLRGQRCLIIGGRQSAFEWAALLVEDGAAEVHVSHRHPTPAFEDSEWGWITTAVTRFVKEPNWYRELSGTEKEQIHARFSEARIKLEPWLWPRIDKDNVKLWPETQIRSCVEKDGALHIVLDNDQHLVVDHVVLATGYKVNMKQVPFLARDLLEELTLNDGSPRLDSQMQSSIPGLFITSLPASGDFGPFFGFTVAVKSSAKLIINALR
jgi:cation diffusion facilitator CzcD-associated flavoprotein CzcO